MTRWSGAQIAKQTNGKHQIACRILCQAAATVVVVIVVAEHEAVRRKKNHKKLFQSREHNRH